MYSNSTVGAAAHCFIDVIIQTMNLAIPQFPLDSTNSLTVFLLHRFTVWGKIFIFVGDKEINSIITAVNFRTARIC